MNRELRVTLIQSNIHWENIPGNLSMFEGKIRSIHDTDLIVLPEMFSTGFTMNAERLAEEMDGRTLQWMGTLSREVNATICGSIIIRAEGAFYNRFIWMRPDGTFEYYDKRHLFSLAKEHETFTAGTRKLLIRHGEWTICPQICYDLRFPVWSRNAEGYDVLLNVASWPEKRGLAWRTLLRARAIENQCYVVGLSRVGDDGEGVLQSGSSAVIDPMGEVVWEGSPVDEAIQTVTLSSQSIYETRRKLPFLKDRDLFELKAT